MFASASGLLVLLAAIPLVIYYFFSKEHRDLSVPSLLFWRNLLEGRPPTFSRRVTRFVGQPLFWIQLAILAVLALLLAGPIAGVKGKLVVFILDTSASMGTREGSETRLELARRRVREALEALPLEHPVALVTVDRVARLSSPPEDGREAFRRRLDEIVPGSGGTRLESAAHLLRFIEARNPVAKTYVYTDRSPPGEGSAGAAETPLPPGLEWNTVGKAADNLGIVALRVDSSLVGEGKQKVRAWILNAGGQDREAVLERRGPGGPLAAGSLSGESPRTHLAAGATGEISFDLPLSFAGPLTLELAGEDALDVDDRAFLSIPAGGGDKLVVGHVAGASPAGRLSALSRLSGIEVRAGAVPGADLLLREIPLGKDVPLPDLPSLTFLAARAPALLGPAGSEPRIRLIPWSSAHPAIDGVLAERIRPSRAVPLEPPAGAEPLYRAGDVCVAFAIEDRGRRHVVFGFSAEEALEEDAGLLLLLQALEWAHPRALRPGSICRTSDEPPPDARRARWTGPAGDLASAPDRFEAPGVYQAVLTDGANRTFAASLLDAEETSLAPAPALFPTGRGEESVLEAAVLDKEVFWKPVVPAAMALLMLEWLVFQRALRRRRLA